MVERQDIDALLISALYGELTPAEETRLAAHLESHPADRTALDDLTRAREVVQKSRILTYQYEPPQSVSALLMQEASRRAPKKAREGEGWFARFVRSFIQHPAMAAAAMLVVVVGAASLVSRTSKDQFAETPPVETGKSNESAPAVAVETPDTTVAAPSAPSAGPTGGDALGSSDQYKITLADEQKLEPKPADKADVAKTEATKQRQQALPETDPNAAFYDSSGLSDRKAGEAVVTKPAVKGTPDTGIELRRRDPAPKDFDEAKPEKPAEEKLAKKAPPRTEARYGSVAPADDSRAEAGYANDGRAANNNTRAGGGGAAPGAAATTAPTTTAQNPTARDATPPRNAAPPPPPKTAPQQIATDTATTGSGSRDAQKSKEKAANDPNLAWAKDQHAALVTAVRANNCGRAANIALSIANRTPSYYAQNVETDRSVKECIAYINNEREKDAEVRASRAKKSQLKNAEPSAPKRAADQPSKATKTDSSK